MGAPSDWPDEATRRADLESQLRVRALLDRARMSLHRLTNEQIDRVQRALRHLATEAYVCVKHAPRASWTRIGEPTAKFAEALALAGRHAARPEIAVFLDYKPHGGIQIWTSTAPDVANTFESLWLRAPWQPVEMAHTLQEELAREMSPEHPLNGLMATAIARRGDCDDVLFEVTGAPFTLAVVHLTWSEERDPRWPATETYRDWAEFAANRLQPDAREWIELNGGEEEEQRQ